MRTCFDRDVYHHGGPVYLSISLIIINQHEIKTDLIYFLVNYSSVHVVQCVCIYTTIQKFKRHNLKWSLLKLYQIIHTIVFTDSFMNSAHSTGIEWTDIKHRTFTGTIISLGWSVGNMLLALLAYLIRDWRHLILVVTSPCLVGIIAWWWVAELQVKE